MNRILSSLRGLFCSTVAIAAVVVTSNVRANPPEGVLEMGHASARAVLAVQERVTSELMSLEDILGTAVGLDNSGNVAALVVYVDQNSRNVPDIVQVLSPKALGVAVRVEMTDEFRALKGPPPGKGPGGGGDGGSDDTSVSHTALQSTPIQLGTSGGWRADLANGYCCGGTLGSLVQVNGTQYILSNYHVLEADIVKGGNGTVAETGNPVIQPGLIDVACDANSAQNVATLEALGALPNANVDCAVAEVVKGMVSSDGAILEIGVISSQTVGASLNQRVKKSGRTTGLTFSKVSGLNATIRVTYQNECAGGTAFTKTFTGQIVIANRGSKFLAGGDSGSLMVEDAAANPRAVGLLYAGSSTSAIANPIDEVLAFLGSRLKGTAAMVGD